MQETEQIYSKYFCMPANIENVYHRCYTINGKHMAPQIRYCEDMNQTELNLRRAMCLFKTGEIGFDATYVPLCAIESVLLNVPKIQDEKLKKRILHYFRLYGNELNRIIHGRGEDVLNAVARVAISQNLANSHDYACCIRNTKNDTEMRKKLINDLIRQAKSDIKFEMEQNIPESTQIKLICENVIQSTYSLPQKTREVLIKEFDFQKILLGGDYIGNFEKTIEIEHADATELDEKILACSNLISDYNNAKSENVRLQEKNQKLEKEKAELERKLKKYYAIVSDYQNIQQEKNNLLIENVQVKQKNKTLKDTVKKLQDQANTMRSSLFSRGVNEYKGFIKGLCETLEK